MISGYRGEYSHAIDAKGRLIIPVKFREALGEGFVVTKGFDGCLFVFDAEGWNAFEEKLRALPLDNKDARKLSRFFLASAIDAEVDKQGRVLLSSSLIAHAGIVKEAKIAGVGSHVEIWSAERFAAEADYEDIDEIAANMSTYGLRI